jgi:hypothetical protein
MQREEKGKKGKKKEEKEEKICTKQCHFYR